MSIYYRHSTLKNNIKKSQSWQNINQNQLSIKYNFHINSNIKKYKFSHTNRFDRENLHNKSEIFHSPHIPERTKARFHRRHKSDHS